MFYTYISDINVTSISKLSPFRESVLERFYNPMVRQNCTIDIADAVFCKVVTIEDVQDEREYYTGTRKRRRKQLIAVSEGALDGILPNDGVVRQVFCSYDASRLLDVLHQLLGEGAVVDLVSVAFRDDSQGFAELFGLYVSAGLFVAAVLVEEPFSTIK